MDTLSVDVPDTARLFEANYDQICQYISSMIHDPVVAEDLTQETLLRAFQQRDSLRNQGALLPWLYRIATNVCLDRLRQRAGRVRSRSAKRSRICAWGAVLFLSRRVPLVFRCSLRWRGTHS